MHQHHRSVMTAVVGVGEPIAAVDFVELAVRPTQRVTDPTRCAALFLLQQELKSVCVADALRDLIFPNRI